MRTRTGQARLGNIGRACPGAVDSIQRTTGDAAGDGLPARTTDELVAAARAHFAAPPCEAAAVLGVTNGRVDDVVPAALDDGEAPVLAAIQAVLERSASAALVVFTDRRPPQWVVQPCYLLGEVAVVGNRAQHSQAGGTS